MDNSCRNKIKEKVMRSYEIEFAEDMLRKHGDYRGVNSALRKAKKDNMFSDCAEVLLSAYEREYLNIISNTLYQNFVRNENERMGELKKIIEKGNINYASEIGNVSNSMKSFISILSDQMIGNIESEVLYSSAKVNILSKHKYALDKIARRKRKKIGHLFLLAIIFSTFISTLLINYFKLDWNTIEPWTAILAVVMSCFCLLYFIYTGSFFDIFKNIETITEKNKQDLYGLYRFSDEYLRVYEEKLEKLNNQLKNIKKDS